MTEYDFYEQFRGDIPPRNVRNKVVLYAGFDVVNTGTPGRIIDTNGKMAFVQFEGFGTVNFYIPLFLLEETKS